MISPIKYKGHFMAAFPEANLLGKTYFFKLNRMSQQKEGTYRKPTRM